mmetsp:Transcript_30145/g.92216  ORF Transcript_30145/g.92216 Transcript_30145/m.92216 type:complete len:339 (-) Transcript_30145:173-1189(-)|eukprot:CAMPEP_0198657438 /NCGR_PEP_ID=MMETSP1467-20131203/15793_1 /TAXON_ID=1462469 /ORGANISM="unid. sp., Strain CCMP2135" /LENGTH=338 /DNA_ID=CAMNT_0044393615 /DNA_START=60 /DNA_END=1076 /DNA_ORIENTATION=+
MPGRQSTHHLNQNDQKATIDDLRAVAFCSFLLLLSIFLEDIAVVSSVMVVLFARSKSLTLYVALSIIAAAGAWFLAHLLWRALIFWVVVRTTAPFVARGVDVALHIVPVPKRRVWAIVPALYRVALTDNAKRRCRRRTYASCALVVTCWLFSLSGHCVHSHVQTWAEPAPGLLSLSWNVLSPLLRRLTEVHGMFIHTDDDANIPVVFTACHDGDTCTVQLPGLPKVFGRNLGVRLTGIDAPELHGQCPYERCLAKHAKDKLNSIVLQGHPQLRDCGRDKYFRLNCRVEVNGIDAATSLVADGLAARYTGRGPRPSWCDTNRMDLSSSTRKTCFEAVQL